MKIIRKFSQQLLTAIFAMLILFITILSELPLVADAAVTSDKAVKTYINATEKYLYLGEEGIKTFDFDIKSSVKGVKKSEWYVNTKKGKPESILLDQETGVVKAVQAGKAYIICKIILADGRILENEAKVIVRNNITKVAIGNIPVDGCIPVGSKYEFKHSILNTAAGKDKVTDGIVRWEVAEDITGGTTVSEEGIVEPLKEGSFRIRAVCFQSIEKYKLWRSNSDKYTSYITASSDWTTIKVTPVSRKARVVSQEELNQYLLEDGIEEITLSTSSAMTFTIPEGNYSNKSIVLDAQHANVVNHGVFKQIIIITAKEKSWTEYASGNTFFIKISNPIELTIEEYASVEKIVADSSMNYISLYNKGSIKLVRLLQATHLQIRGYINRIAVEIESTAGESSVKSSVPLDLTINAASNISLTAGAENTNITKVSNTFDGKIENYTKQPITMVSYNWYDQTIKAGASSYIYPVEGASLMKMNIPVMASLKVFVNGKGSNYYNGKLHTTKDSILSDIMISLNEQVQLVDAPVAILYAPDKAREFGEVILEASDENKKTLLIRFAEEDSTLTQIGTYSVVIPNGAIKDSDGNVNEVIQINIIVF